MREPKLGSSPLKAPEASRLTASRCPEELAEAEAEVEVEAEAEAVEETEEAVEKAGDGRREEEGAAGVGVEVGVRDAAYAADVGEVSEVGEPIAIAEDRCLLVRGIGTDPPVPEV
jgi:hypothetical protein